MSNIITKAHPVPDMHSTGLLCRMRDDAKLLHFRLFQMPSCTSWFTKNVQGYRLYSRLLQGGFREACTRVCFVRAIPYIVL